MSLLGLWLPDSAAKAEQHKYSCTACGAKFKAKEKPRYEQHMAMCSKAFAPEIEAEAAQRSANVFLDGSVDPERTKWIRDRIEDPLKQFDDMKDGLAV